eukprot:934329_1
MEIIQGQYMCLQFTRNKTSNERQQTQIVSASDALANGYFGYSLAMHSNRAMIGAHWSDVGSVYVFLLNPSSNIWEEEDQLRPDGIQRSGDLFGCDLSLGDTYGIIGAYGVDTERGAVYIYTHSRTDNSTTEKFCHGALAGLCAFIVCGCAIYCCNDECNQRKAHKKEAPAGRKHSEFETESEYVEYDMVSPSAPVDLEIELEEVMLLQNRISNHNSPTMTRDYGESEGVSEYDDIKQWFENETVLKEDEIEEYFDTFIANGFTDLKIIKMITDNDLKQINIHKLGHRKEILAAATNILVEPPSH